MSEEFVIVDKEDLTAIADAVRESTGSTEEFNVSELRMATIDALSAGGTSGGETFNFPYTQTIGESAFNGCTELTSANFPVATSVGTRAFKSCTGLTSVDLPKARSVGFGAFEGCTSLTSVNLPVATSFDSSTFYCCDALTSVNLPVATSIGNFAFERCTSLTSVDLPAVTSIGALVFDGCTSLEALILRNATGVVQCSDMPLSDTGIENGTGYVYVPKALVEQYKVANNWSDYASQFRALEDYTVDGTITGELDESKI